MEGEQKMTLKERAIFYSVLFGSFLVFALWVRVSFVKMGMKATYSEADANLWMIREAQKTYYKNYGTFAGSGPGEDCFKLIGWQPHYPEKTIYSYYCGKDKIESGRFPGECPDPPPVAASAAGFTLMAVGNLDRDPDCDVWFMDKRGDRRKMKMLKDGTLVEGEDVDDIPFLDIFRPSKLKLKESP